MNDSILLNEQCPEVMEQIYHDLKTGCRVLGIPEMNFKIQLFNHEPINRIKCRYGYVLEEASLQIFLADKMIETERDKANLSFVVWSTLRWWNRHKCLRHWRETHELFGNIIESDLEVFRDYICPLVWHLEEDKHNGQKYSDQTVLHDMYAFALMMMRRYWSEYISDYQTHNYVSVQKRADELYSRYFANDL